MDNLGKYLRLLRSKNNCLIRDVAGSIQADPAIISKIERGLRYPGRGQVLKFARYYQVDPNSLVTLWLGDKLIREIIQEDMAREALQIAERAIIRRDTPNFSEKEIMTGILDSIRNIQVFSKDLTMDQFLNSRLIQSGISFQLILIGEAISRVDPVLLEKFDYPWIIVKSFRNLIVSNSLETSPEKIWNTVNEQIPGLETVINLILNKEFGYDGN